MPGQTKQSPIDTPADDDYSDSFESADEHFTPKKRRANKMSRKPVLTNRGRVSPTQLDEVARRMLSARRRRINDLSSQMDTLERDLADARLENKTLRRQNFRQEKALEKSLQIDHSQTELPSLIERHAEEVRSLREQCKRYKEKSQTEGKARKESEADSARLKRQLVRLKELTEDRNLGERDTLRKEVTDLKEELAEKDKKIQDLEKMLELLQKNHKVELGNEIHKHRDAHKTVAELQEKITQLESQLREKEKVLEIQNIYSQRVMRAPHRLDTAASSQSSLHHFQFASRNGSDSRVNDLPEITPRERVKQFEEKRRADQRRKLERRQQKKVEMVDDRASGIIEDPTEAEYDSKETIEERDHSSEDDAGVDREQEMIQQEREEKAAQEEERRRIKEESNRKKREEEEREQHRLQEEKDKQERDEAERIKKQNEEEAERIKKQNEEEAEQQRKIEEEQEKKRLAKEQKQAKIDAERQLKATEEERKRKEELLARLRELDEQQKSKDSIDDDTKHSPPPTELKKKFSVSDSIENLHRGRPASNEYPRPAYLTKRRESEENREKKLITELFGPSATGTESTVNANKHEKSDIDREDASPTDSRRLAVVQPRRTGMPWDNESDESGKLLPRRPSNPRTAPQPPAQQPRPLMRHTAAPPGMIDDDIEELML